MPAKESHNLFQELVKTMRATVYGTLVIGVLEGTYGGILFALLDIPSPILWGCLMILLSILPLVGTNAVLFPAALFHLITGNWTGGLLLLILGSGAILVSQNIIRPKFVGTRSGVHPAIIVVSTIGGIAWLGLIGFLIGPLVASLFITLWNQFGLRYNHESEALKSKA